MKTGNRQKAAANSTKAKVSGFALCVLLLAHGVPAEAQQSKNHPRIGYLTGGFASGGSPRTDAFRQGLRELGYVEGKNIVIEYRYAEGKLDRLPALAAELVRLNVQIIVAGGGGGATRSAKEATKAIPIVMAQDSDPVGNGFVASLAQTGGKCDRVVLAQYGPIWKEVGATQRNLTQALPRGRLGDFNGDNELIIKGGGTGRTGDWSGASIPRDSRFQGY